MNQATPNYTSDAEHLRTPQARWAAIAAGVAVAIATLSFLHLLGLAIGVSVIDLSDAAAFGEGLGIGVIIWSILSWVASLFVGAMLAARLSGEGSETVGLLNGVTLWATTSILVMVLAFTSMASILGGTLSLASTAVSASASAVKSTGEAVGSAVGSGASYLQEGDSVVADEVAATLKDQASREVARLGGEDGPSADEVRRSIDQLDSDTVRAFAGHLVEGDIDAATEELADDVALSERDLRQLVDGASERVQQLLGNAGDGESLSEDVLNRTKSTLAEGLAGLDSPGGPDVTRSDIRSALDDLDPAVMRTIAWRLVQGDVEGAQSALVANTSLSRAEADDLISGIEEDLGATVDRYQEQAAEYADTAGDYAQGVLWGAVFVSTLSLGASALGGWIGTRPVVRRNVPARTPTAAR